MNRFLLSTSLAGLGFFPLAQQQSEPAAPEPQCTAVSVPLIAPVALGVRVAEVGPSGSLAPVVAVARVAEPSVGPIGCTVNVQSSSNDVEATLSTIDWSTSAPAAPQAGEPAAMRRVRLAAPVVPHQPNLAGRLDNETEVLRERVRELEAKLEALLNSQEQVRKTREIVRRLAAEPRTGTGQGGASAQSGTGATRVRVEGRPDSRVIVRELVSDNGTHDVLLEEIKGAIAGVGHETSDSKVFDRIGSTTKPGVTVWHSNDGDHEVHVIREVECEESSKSKDAGCAESNKEEFNFKLAFPSMGGSGFIQAEDFDLGDLDRLQVNWEDLDVDLSEFDFDVSELDLAELGCNVEEFVKSVTDGSNKILVELKRGGPHTSGQHGNQKVFVRRLENSKPKVTSERFASVPAKVAPISLGTGGGTVAPVARRAGVIAEQDWAEELSTMRAELRELREVVHNLHIELKHLAPGVSRVQEHGSIR